MDSAVAGLIGAVIGASAGIIGSWINNRYQLTLEKEKSRLALQSALSRELRATVSEVGREMLSIQHSMEWVCWLAEKDQDLTGEAISSKYDKEIHEGIPKLLGTLAVVASLEKTLHEQLMGLADKLFRLDGKIADAFVDNKDSPKELSNALKACHAETVDLYKLLPMEIARIMQSSGEGLGEKTQHEQKGYHT